MIDFKIGNEFLDIPDNVELSVEETSSLFSQDYVPGLFTYPIILPLTAKNLRLLGHPDLLSTEASVLEKDAACFVGGILWKTGKLNILKTNGKGISVNFTSGAGAITGTDISLQEIDMGSDSLSFQTANCYPAATHILFPVKNEIFYGEANPFFKGYVNYYHNGFKRNVDIFSYYNVVPFPFLSYIFRKVMAHFGYTVKPGWLDSPEIAKVVIYNNFALDSGGGGINDFQTTIDFRNHVPEMKAVDFLNTIRCRYFLDFHFNAAARTLEIIPLRDIIANPAYIDQSSKIAPEYETEPNTSDGFVLEMQLDDSDELTKVATWNRFKLGNGGETISTAASTLEMYNGLAEGGAKEWLVPVAAQKGSSPEFGIGVNKCGLRLLNYLGMQPDSNGDLYPLGSWDVVNYAGTVVGAVSQRWAGPHGIYLQYAKPWLDFRSTTRLIERECRLDIVDLLTLNHKRKWLTRGPEGTVKMLYEKLTYFISNTGIKPTKGTFYKTTL